MRKLASVSLAAALAGSAFVAFGAGPASANVATPCVTKAEFAKVTHGMTRTRVADLFGTDGRLVLRLSVGGHVYTQREYTPCLRASYVSVSYKDLKETAKSATWSAAGSRTAPLDGITLGDLPAPVAAKLLATGR